MDKYRLLFQKVGRGIYISHLDLMRTMQRAFRRAALPIRYSEGFNPHALMSFLLPLSVGTESVCELLDFRLTEALSPEEIPARLAPCLPEGLVPLACWEPVRKVAQLKWLRVSGRMEYDHADPAAMAAGLEAFYRRESIVIQKKTKRGMGESDIRPAIREICFLAGEGQVKLEAVISAQEPTLNPDLLADALRQLAPELAPDFAAFRREEVYDQEMTVFR